MRRLASAAVLSALSALSTLSAHCGAEPAPDMDRAGYDACIATYAAATASVKAARWLAGTCEREYLRVRPANALDQCFKHSLPQAQNDVAAMQRFRHCQRRWLNAS